MSDRRIDQVMVVIQLALLVALSLMHYTNTMGARIRRRERRLQKQYGRYLRKNRSDPP